MWLHELKKIQLQERFMLTTQDFIGHLKTLCMSILLLSSGVESEWKPYSSPLSVEKMLAFWYESSFSISGPTMPLCSGLEMGALKKELHPKPKLSMFCALSKKLRMNVFIRVGSRHQRNFKTVQQHSHFWSEYFRETLLRPQRMVAECWLTDSLLELAVDGVLDLGVSSKES